MERPFRWNPYRCSTPASSNRDSFPPRHSCTRCRLHSKRGLHEAVSARQESTGFLCCTLGGQYAPHSLQAVSDSSSVQGEKILRRLAPGTKTDRLACAYGTKR